jgi:hypothetical protein
MEIIFPNLLMPSMYHIIKECTTSLKEEGWPNTFVHFLNGGTKKVVLKKRGSKVKKIYK